MDARKASLAGAATLIGGGMLAARSLAPKLHEHCKTMQDKCSHDAAAGDEPADHKCSPKAACVASMNAGEVK